MKMRASVLSRLVVVGCVLAAALIASPSLSGQNAKESFSGFAINTNGGRAMTGSVDFTIERWSTDAERAQLLSILQEEKDRFKANDKLLKALQKMPKVGRISTPGRLAWDLRYARQSELDEGGRRIVLGTDRPIGFGEARNGSRTLDYPFTILEMQLDRDDKGVGKILAGTKLFIDKKNNLVLENYSQQPIQFNEIKKVK